MTYGTSSSSCTRFVLPQGPLRPLSLALGADKASYLASKCFFITIVTSLVLMLKTYFSCRQLGYIPGVTV